jgi:MarR family 2-MHQ and catechol resistance regulon transcriptional repressor
MCLTGTRDAGRIELGGVAFLPQAVLSAPERLEKGLKVANPTTPPGGHSPQYYAGVSLIRTADSISNRFGRLLREQGLTNQQYNVLRILRREGRALPSLEVAERLIQQVPAITGLIDRLEKQSLVVRRRCEQDRRVIWVEITPAGLELLSRLDQPVEELTQRLFAQFSIEQLQRLTELLEALYSSIPEDTEE